MRKPSCHQRRFQLARRLAGIITTIPYSPRPARRRSRFESLEDRRLLAILTVTNLNDSGVGSLRQAIIDANGAAGADLIQFDSGVFNSASGPIRLTSGELVITEAVTIDALAGGASGVTITGDANGDDVLVSGTQITDAVASLNGQDLLSDNSRLLNITANSGDVDLVGLTLTGGRTTGDADGLGDRTYDGGAIRSLSSGGLTMIASTVSGNSTKGSNAYGGGIASHVGDVTLSDSNVSGNHTQGFAAFGGGISTFYGDVTLTSSTVSGNYTQESGADGGGIFTADGNVTLTGSTVSGNRTLGSSVLLNAEGGGIVSWNGAVTLTDSTVSGNRTQGSSAFGGGIFTYNGAVTLTSSTVSGNRTQGNGAAGGGIFTFNGAVTLASSTVSGNLTEGLGAHGGGLWVHNSIVTIVNSTIVGNSANSASGTGGGIGMQVDFFNQKLTIHNSIIAGNNDGGTAPDFIEPFDPDSGTPGNQNLDVQYSLIGSTTGNNTPASPGNLLNQDAVLGPLADNGGPTQTHALSAGSPAINAGNNALAVDLSSNPLTNDQRGAPFTRNDGGGIDMGAYERQTFAASSFVVTTATDELDYSNNDVSLREAINSANGSLGADTISFDPSAFDGQPNDLIRLTMGELVITEAVTIDGLAGGASDVTISGDANGDDVLVSGTQITDAVASLNGQDLLSDNSRLLNITATSGDVDLVGLTLTGGRTTADNLPFTLTHDGGAIRSLSTGDLTLIAGRVSGNSTQGSRSNGGGISNNAGALTLIDTIVSGNHTEGSDASGGGISSSDVTLIDSTVSGNHTQGSGASGGGIFKRFGGLTLLDSTVSGNHTRGSYASGGGISTFRTSAVTLTNSTVNANHTEGNNADGGGMAISAYNSNAIMLTDSTISGNHTKGSSATGGGISFFVWATPVLVQPPLTLTDSTVSGNYTQGIDANGGGISTDSGDLTLTDSTVSGNHTQGSSANGGGIFNATGAVTLTNSTLSGNHVDEDNTYRNADGGGLWVDNSLVTMDNSTITNNSASDTGGGIGMLVDGLDQLLTIHNSIIAGNSAGTAPDFIAPYDDPLIAGTENLDVQHSLIGDGTGTTLPASSMQDPSTGNFVGTTSTPIDAMLGPLAVNGGPTLTRSLLPGSPALNAGDNSLVPVGVNYDQRGWPFSRFAGSTVDMGAYEANVFDFGDAPTAAQSGFAQDYPVSLAQNGAFHFNSSDVFLGSAADQEADGQPSAGATGDGADDDGITSFPDLVPGQTNVSINVNVTNYLELGASIDASLFGWIDFNRDGDWDDLGEAVVVDAFVPHGGGTVSIDIPAAALTGTTYARFRVVSIFDAPVTPYGGATTGEVEDYAVSIVTAPQVDSVQINDGGVGRSMITSLTVSFDSEVDTTLLQDAFSVLNIDTSTAVGHINVDTSGSVSGQTIAVLSFSGASTVDRLGAGVLGDSLADGNYRLTVDASKVLATGTNIEMATHHIFGGKTRVDETPYDPNNDNFFRHYGDDDGDGNTDFIDFSDGFLPSFGNGVGDPNYDPALDHDGDGNVDFIDFSNGFLPNFGTGRL